jgi:OFA family oxalate/formate antiporter-like MFS transporter
MIEQSGYRATFLTWGVIQGVVLAVLARFMAAPASTWRPGGEEKASALRHRLRQSRVSYTPLQMLRTGAFSVMYAISTLVLFGGLVVTAQLKPIAAAYELDTAMAFPGVTALALALMFTLVVSGLARPFWGWLSDRIGRYSAMGMAFALGALAIVAMAGLLARPFWFVMGSGMTVFAWGATFVLFSAAVGDVFGPEYAAANNGVLYTSKGVASIFSGWGAAKLLERTGSWLPVLWVAFACNLAAALLALLCLRPMVARLTAR